MDELKGLTITMAEELLDEDFHSDSTSTNNYFTNSEIPTEEQVSELSNVTKID